MKYTVKSTIIYVVVANDISTPVYFSTCKNKVYEDFFKPKVEEYIEEGSASDVNEAMTDMLESVEHSNINKPIYSIFLLRAGYIFNENEPIDWNTLFD